MASEIELLREKLNELRKLRDNATLEKGMAAEENKDLRENFAYDYWENQERNITYRIYGVMEEIHTAATKKGISTKTKVVKPKSATKNKSERNKEKVNKPKKQLPQEPETSGHFLDSF